MALTPLDIHNKEFNRGMRGYREQEVDEFLDQIVREMDTLLKENAGLKEQMQTLSAKVEQYRRLEETLQNTLVVAQETAEELKNNARKEAELIVREADQQAQRLVREGEERIDDLRRRYDELRKEVTVFRARVRGMLTTQMEILAAPWEGAEERGEYQPRYDYGYASPSAAGLDTDEEPDGAGESEEYQSEEGAEEADR